MGPFTATPQIDKLPTTTTTKLKHVQKHPLQIDSRGPQLIAILSVQT